MAREVYQQYAIVQGDTAQQLTDRLNARLYDLRRKHPSVSFEGLIARISYEEDEVTIESPADEYRAAGINLTCQDCPAFKPIMSRDGTEDRRSKWGDCPHAMMGRTRRDTKACDKLFQMIDSGEVKLCWAE
jgi:hypothetical protein